MREEDVLRFVWIADPRISPDGTRIAFTRVHVDEAADQYRTSLWLADAEGGAAPRALTFGDFDSEPRWSPDGRTLAFVRKPDREKPGQLHLLPLGGGEARAITKLEKGVSQPAWSPDGARIAFLSGTNPALDDPAKPKPKNEPGRLVTKPVFRMNGEGFVDFDHLDHVWVVDLAGGEPRALTRGEFPAAAPEWSKDGKWIYFLSDRRPEPWFGDEDVQLYAVSADLEPPTDGAGMKLVADFAGPIAAFTEGADGSIAVVGSVRTAPMLSYVRNDVLTFAAGGWPRTGPVNLTGPHDFDAAESISSDQHPPRGGGAMPFVFEPGGRSLLAVAGRHGSARLARCPATPGAVEELTPVELEVTCGSVSADGRRVAMTMGSVGRPGDLYVYDVPSRRLSKVWGPNDAWIDPATLGEVEEIWYPSFDGRKIQGWIVKPPGFDPRKKYPLILEIHGGPHTAYGVGFFHEFRVLAAAGYVVLYTNPRGSTTYGQEFGNIIQYRYPGDDVQDLLLGVEAVVARGYIDEKRMGVTGGSGGGLLTNWIIAHDHRFAAAITQRCVADWISMYYSSDFALFTPFWFRKPPFEDPMEYLERSPAHFAAKIETPLLVLHSEEDWRTPIGQGETMFRALKQLRKPVAMVRFPGESHELSRSGAPSRRVQNQQHIRRWFDRWLQDQPAPEYQV